MPFNAAQVRWNRDIECGFAAMTTTGGHLWNASERLAGVALPVQLHAWCRFSALLHILDGLSWHTISLDPGSETCWMIVCRLH